MLPGSIPSASHGWDPLEASIWEDHLGYLIGRNNLAKNGHGKDFHGAGTQISEADWYYREPWVQFLIGRSWNDRGRQLGGLMLVQQAH